MLKARARDAWAGAQVERVQACQARKGLVSEGAAAIKVQRDAFLALTASITSATGGTRITSGTENGQSFTATYEKKETERLNVLTILMGMLERDSAGSKSTLGRFI